MDEILRFLWTAFFDYWKTWVTGTGIIGFGFFLLHLYERNRGKTMTPKKYGMVLFCSFWFFATFSAWHDAQKNLRNVIGQREKDTSNLGECNSDLRAERVLTSSWQGRFSDQQKVINDFQGPQLQQQATLSTCVVALGKVNSPEPIRIMNRVMPIEKLPNTVHSTTEAGVLIAETNRRIAAFSGKIVCPQPFFVQQIALLQGAMSQSPSYQQKPGQTVLAMDFSGSAWDTQQPLVAFVAGDKLDVMRCAIMQQ